MHGYWSVDIIGSEKTNSSSSWRTVSFQGQISEHIFAPNGAYCVYYSLYIFNNTCDFENSEYRQDNGQFKLENFQKRDLF